MHREHSGEGIFLRWCCILFVGHKPFYSLKEASHLPGESRWYSFSDASQSMLWKVAVSHPNFVWKYSCMIGLQYACVACVDILDVTLLLLRTNAAWVEGKSGVCWRCRQSLHAW